MATAVYVEKNGGHFEYFVCTAPDENDKKCIEIDADVVAGESCKNVNFIESVLLDECHRIEKSAFESCKELQTVLFGRKGSKTKSLIGLTVATVDKLSIQHAAFKNCAKLQAVVLPITSGKLVIEKEAFAGCGELRTVVFGESNKIDISEEAFIGCTKVTFICASDSAAERYAREHGVRIVNF